MHISQIHTLQIRHLLNRENSLQNRQAGEWVGVSSSRAKEGLRIGARGGGDEAPLPLLSIPPPPAPLCCLHSCFLCSFFLCVLPQTPASLLDLAPNSAFYLCFLPLLSIPPPPAPLCWPLLIPLISMIFLHVFPQTPTFEHSPFVACTSDFYVLSVCVSSD